MADSELLRRRYFTESIIWKILEPNPPLFRYVQEPVYSLSMIEEFIIEFLHQNKLNFELQPRYTPDRFIILTVNFNGEIQKVKLECNSSLITLCTFSTARTKFAENFKGWLDRTFGVEHFDSSQYVATKRWISYTYVLPIYELLAQNFQTNTRLEFTDSRHISYLFNFNSKEKEFLQLLEKVILNRSVSDNPLKVKVYPRTSHTGSIEMVINDRYNKQPVRVFSSGSHPIIYQIITENSDLVEQLKNYLDQSLGIQSFDKANSKLKGKMLSYIYTHRSPESIEKLFQDD